jgi:hypothetical protein
LCFVSGLPVLSAVATAMVILRSGRSLYVGLYIEN